MLEPSEAPQWDQGVDGTEVPELINRDEPLIRVEAGPGTGKTLGLKRRVVRLLHPAGLAHNKNQVLVVAFNRVIAADLRSEIKRELENFGIVEKLPRVRTLHGLCLEILGPDTRMLMPHERDAMLYDAVNMDPRLAEEFKRHPEVEQALHNHEAGNAKHNLLRQVVQTWLNRHGKARLVGDLPGELVDGIKGGNHPEPRFQHILVDEFQDLTEHQHHLVFALLAETGNLVALGDRRQSIYRFLGNDPEGLARLETLSKHKVCDIPITACHRCPADVVKAANQLMEISGAAPMTPGSTAQPNTHVVYWRTPSSEAKGMAKAVLENFHAFPEEKHLVMVTKKKFGTMLRDEIHVLDPEAAVDLNFQEGILDEWAVREAFLFLSLLLDPDPPSWRAWFAYKNDPTGDVYLKTAQRNSPAYLDFLSQCGDSISTDRLSDLVAEKLQISGPGANCLLEGRPAF
jgi:superfamily I DNA/RNA helicase